MKEDQKACCVNSLAAPHCVAHTTQLTRLRIVSPCVSDLVEGRGEWTVVLCVVSFFDTETA